VLKSTRCSDDSWLLADRARVEFERGNPSVSVGLIAQALLLGLDASRTGALQSVGAGSLSRKRSNGFGVAQTAQIGALNQCRFPMEFAATRAMGARIGRLPVHWSVVFFGNGRANAGLRSTGARRASQANGDNYLARAPMDSRAANRAWRHSPERLAAVSRKGPGYLTLGSRWLAF